MKVNRTRDFTTYFLAAAMTVTVIIDFNASLELSRVLSWVGADLFLMYSWRDSFSFDDRPALNIMLVALLIAVPLQLYELQYHVTWAGAVGSGVSLAGAFILIRRANRIAKKGNSS